MTPESLQLFDTSDTSETIAPGSRSLAVDETGDLVLLGGADGVAQVYSLSKSAIVQSLKCGSGAVVDGTWYGNRPVVALSSGAVNVFEDGRELASFTQHAGAATSVCMHPCGDIVASVGVDKTFVLYDLQTMKPITQQSTESGKHSNLTGTRIRKLTCIRPHLRCISPRRPSLRRRHCLWRD